MVLDDVTWCVMFTYNVQFEVFQNENDGMILEHIL